MMIDQTFQVGLHEVNVLYRVQHIEYPRNDKKEKEIIRILFAFSSFYS